jgi:hypothetical protein
MADERNRAEIIIRNPPINCIPIRSEYWGPRSDHTEAVCRKEVRGAHIILVLLAEEFSQMVKFEYNEANKPPKKDILVFLRQPRGTIDPRLKEFTSEIQKEYFTGGREFKDLDDFEEMAKESIVSTFEKRYQRHGQRGLAIDYDESNPNLLGLIEYENRPLIRKFARLEI